MRIGVIGTGRIGGNCARFFAAAGHDVLVSFSRDEEKLRAFAAEIGGTTGSPADATRHGEVVVFAVPWSLIDDALAQAGGLADRIVIDTTNQYGSGPMPAAGQTAAELNAGRMDGARYTKSFNTLTSAFQAEAAGRAGDERVVQWLCGDDEDAKAIVAELIRDAGFVPIDVGSNAQATVMEAPRRAGAVYGEEYREADARAVVEAVHAGRPIPPTPSY
jgi:predicted dinucleotide-binding enzyme